MRRAFTLIELLVVISIIALLIAILLPALGAARFQATLTQNATQQRGLFQAFAMYAESNDGVFPGLEKSGSQPSLIPGIRGGVPTSSSRQAGDWPSTRFALVVDNDYVSPEYVINPGEFFPREPWTFGKTDIDSAGTEFDWRNFSYAVEEWVGGSTGGNRFKVATANLDSMNAETPVITDRIIVVLDRDFTNINKYVGVYSKDPGDLRIGIAWGDGHTSILNTPIVDTRFGDYRNENDNIYQRTGDDVSVSTSPAPPSGTNVNSKVAYHAPASHQSHPSERP